MKKDEITEDISKPDSGGKTCIICSKALGDYPCGLWNGTELEYYCRECLGKRVNSLLRKRNKVK